MDQVARPPAKPRVESNRFVWVCQDGNQHDASPRYSADIYDLSFTDEFGSPLCIAAGVDLDMVERCWNQYLASRGYTVEVDESPMPKVRLKALRSDSYTGILGGRLRRWEFPHALTSLRCP
jgi:hypothetical protein